MIHHQGTKTPREKIPKEVDDVARIVVDTTFKVHTALGSGLLENVYEVCLAHELTKRSMKFERKVSLPVVYDGEKLDAGLRLDLLI